MAVADEECSSAARSRSSSTSSSSQHPHYLAKCVLKGSAILHIAHGHFDFRPRKTDVFLDYFDAAENEEFEETSIEVVVIDTDGVAQSICEQTVFGIIKDLAVLPRSEKFDQQDNQVAGKDLLVVLSDSGKLSFLTFYNEMNRFFPVANIQISDPGFSRNQIGKMLAIDSTGLFIAVGAYEDSFALFSVSEASGSNIVDERALYSPACEADVVVGRSFQKPTISGTIWSMCFISHHSSKEHDPVFAIILNRKMAVVNELLLFGWNVKGRDIYFISQFVEPGPLAHNIVEVPHLHGFALLFRVGDALLMDLRDAQNPNCVCRTSLNYLPVAVEELGFIEDPCTAEDIIVDEEGSFNDVACALLKLRDHDPMCIEDDNTNAKTISKYVCAWSWEQGTSASSRMILCIDTGELFMLEVCTDLGYKVTVSECLYKEIPSKALLWLGGFVASLVEMGDGKILRFDNEKLTYASSLQNISPILDMSLANIHDEKQDQIFVCCGVAPEGSLRIVRSGISVEKLLKTAPTYQGVTSTWTMKMKVTDSYDSFLGLSFVEETRVLSVGLSFTDVTDSIGFQPDVCTLASGLVGDGLLIQIHRSAVRLCLPTKAAHSDGIPLSSPVCVSWAPSSVGISMGAVGHHFIVVSTSNPCFLVVLGIRTLSTFEHEIYEVQHLILHNEVSCISIPYDCFEQKGHSPMNGRGGRHSAPIPAGVQIGRTFVVGTHRPSVEVVSLIPDQGLRIIASGIISLTNSVGTMISSCIPQDVRLVFVDRLYVLSGLRNGMLLRFEWPTTCWKLSPGFLPLDSGVSPFYGCGNSAMSEILTPRPSTQSQSASAVSEKFEESFCVDLNLIATRRIGITPIFLVPLSNALDADIIALSDRPWVLHTARHGLSYTSISFQSSTHVTPVCSAECPKGVLFVSENSLHLVEMVHSKRLNVQKFHIDGTPQKVLYHGDSKLLLVLRTELDCGDCMSDVCCVDPYTGTVLSTFKFESDELGKSMELVRVGKELVVVIGTTFCNGRTMLPNGEAESTTRGRLVVLCLEHARYSGGIDMSFQNKRCTSSLYTSHHDIDGHLLEQPASSMDDASQNAESDSIILADGEVWKLRSAYSAIWPGMVLAICPYMSQQFLASAGNCFYVCGFQNENPHKVKRFALGRTRFMITSLTSYFTRIAVGDCRDGILFFTYHEDGRKLEQDFCDPSQRLVADCALVDLDTAVVSDRKGGIGVLTCPDRGEDNPSPESNLTLSCAYFMGEIAMSIRKGSFPYKLPADDLLKASDSPIVNIELTHKIVVASTLLGSIFIFIPISWEEYQLLEMVQAKVGVHPLTAPVLGNDHKEFRGRESLAGVPKMLDGDMLTQFLELTSMQQEAVLSLPLHAPDTVKLSSEPFAPIPVNQVVQILERIHYALN
ncbi:hypothetical protein MLD38_033162 [Melastoma candidum]|uniref:Uncharacterized protein n=1 Tax=Melastoma candidum TaxID=119954 RepID=A0ACB9M7X7_9MYRT|nr:hypothetical protein MLD38_033162 [Melastoma candidum]